MQGNVALLKVPKSSITETKLLKWLKYQKNNPKV
jgi:hypothetical protein